MDRARFVKASLCCLAARVLRAKERSYSIFQETTTGEYKVQIQIEGLGSTVTKAVVGIFPLLHKAIQTLPVLTVLKDKTNLVEATGIVIEFGDQPRFVTVSMPLGPRKNMRVSGSWWFLIDGSLPTGFDVNAERKLIAPTSSLTITLARGTTGIAL